MLLRLIPLLLLAIATVALRFSPVDMAVARSVYDPELPQPWTWAWETPWSQLYHYGVWPAWLMAAVGGFCVAKAFGRGRRRRLDRVGLFLILVTSLGPGLLVNLTLKPGYGRPRPRDLVEFGGQYEYVPVLTPVPELDCTSFPSGHAAMAFSLFTPAFLFVRRSKIAAASFVLAGLLFGVAVGTARVLQGAHFVSDIVWSAGIVYLTALVLWRVLKLDEEFDDAAPVSEIAIPDAVAARSP